MAARSIYSQTTATVESLEFSDKFDSAPIRQPVGGVYLFKRNCELRHRRALIHKPMIPTGIRTAPTGANTAERPTRSDRPWYNAQHNREPGLIPASNDRELSHVTSTEANTYDSQYKQDTAPRSKRKRVALFLSKAFKTMRGAILNFVAPARDGTGFFQSEEQKDVFSHAMYNEAGPWHMYERLDSDNEDDRYSRRRPKKAREGRGRLTAAHEDSSTSQRGEEAASTLLRADVSGEIGPKGHTSHAERT
ncbi:hypothetical protein F5Y09DRAFT_352135 [Xylaria sp. FL1042]|nr:hypothetical protein F5Y09DRAFT_352135 [Xylaria sp. FL1042]